MYTEDDTFNRLQRSDFATVLNEVRDNGLMFCYQLKALLKKHHWNHEDYKQALNIHYGSLTTPHRR